MVQASAGCMALLCHLPSSPVTKFHFANSLETMFNEPVPTKAPGIPEKEKVH
jgi:hypothetical protein